MYYLQKVLKEGSYAAAPCITIIRIDSTFLSAQTVFIQHKPTQNTPSLQTHSNYSIRIGGISLKPRSTDK